MSGSYWHVTTDQHHLLDDPKHLLLSYHVTEHGIGCYWAPEAYEAIAHMYSMIWYLADKAAEGDKARAVALVEEAGGDWKAGFAASPGVSPPLDDQG